jgi:drug/metabolite transporter (DMT)-like permease
MTGDPRASRKLFLGLALAIILDTGLQVVWKMAASDLPDQPDFWRTMQGALHQPLFLLVGLFMIGQAFNWMAVLDHADLSYAHAITSLSYVTVAAVSVLALGEIVEWPQVAGIMLILVGVWFVSLSGHSGRPAKDRAS